MSDTIVFPFLSDFFRGHGVSVTFVGAIFGIMSVCMGVACPCVPTLISKVGGPARTLLIGMIGFAGVRLLTALLPFVPDGDMMAWASGIVFAIT
eukprot:6387915-Prymnesium_polylepis.1